MNVCATATPAFSQAQGPAISLVETLEQNCCHLLGISALSLLHPAPKPQTSLGLGFRGLGV